MYRALLYKEWIKSRWYLAAALVVLLAFSTYAMVRLYRPLAMMGAGHIWEVMVMRHAVFVEQMEYLPLLAGLLLAVVQFAPEMHPQVPQADPAPAPVGPSDHGHDAFVRRGGPLALLFGASFAVIVASASPVLARSWSPKSWGCSCRGMPPDGPPTSSRPG